MHRKIMIQGTGSSVGKSLITAGLCRIFSQDGYKVSPFKSQNMALNSFVDFEGLEMSRATVVQAECANEIPRSYMNPILLKPNSDNNSQIIINGKAKYNLNAKDYFSKSKELKKVAEEAYKIIENKYDICVLEGAGSPAEVNLRKYDLVNMGMAEIVDSPVILVGNIEVGGVFASLYGTVMLLDEKDRKRIKGIIINKFRGDKSLLEPAFEILEKKFLQLGLDIKFLGVIPYENIQIDEEDSLNRYVEDENNKTKNEKTIKISIIKTRRISNFSDFNIFKKYDDVEIKYINKEEEIGDEDILILPGSKNTVNDLIDIKNRGIFEKILKAKDDGKIIIGICGGLQMLGEKIFDPDMIESNNKEIDGFNFFTYSTIFSNDKKTKQVEEIIETKEGILKNFLGEKIKGYEIHQGVTNIKNNIICKDNVIATYIHGIFDNVNFTDKLLNIIRSKKGMKIKEKSISYADFKEKEYNKLAKILRENLNIEEIYKILK